MRRVVITGIGVVSSIGIGIPSFWENLLEGKARIKRPTLFDAERYRSKNTTILDYDKALQDIGLSDEEDARLNTCAKIGLIACREALESANLHEHEFYKKAGISVGTTSGGEMCSFIRWFRHGHEMNYSAVKNSPLFSAVCNIASVLKLEGPVCNISSACTSGASSIIYAYEAIRNSDATLMLAGGCDVLQEVAFAGFNSLRIVSPTECIPFAVDRSGLIMGDGGAFLVLEEYETAIKRNAPILAEIKGTGMSCDAYHPTAPNSKGAVQAMKAALADANLDVTDIQYVNCHGTGTILNDRAEAQALSAVFGESISALCATSTKSTLGHLLGTAGSIEAVVTTLVIHTNTIPPMSNFTSPDSTVKFRIVDKAPLHIDVKNAMTNSFGFGGNNASIICSECHS